MRFRIPTPINMRAAADGFLRRACFTPDILFDPAQAVEHDWVHALLRCGPEHEGIVGAAHDFILYGVLPDFASFQTACEGNRMPEDTSAVRDIRRAYRKLVNLACF